jgi:hypothetical protein
VGDDSMTIETISVDWREELFEQIVEAVAA